MLARDLALSLARRLTDVADRLHGTSFAKVESEASEEVLPVLESARGGAEGSGGRIRRIGGLMGWHATSDSAESLLLHLVRAVDLIEAEAEGVGRIDAFAARCAELEPALDEVLLRSDYVGAVNVSCGMAFVRAALVSLRRGVYADLVEAALGSVDGNPHGVLVSGRFDNSWHGRIEAILDRQGVTAKDVRYGIQSIEKGSRIEIRIGAAQKDVGLVSVVAYACSDYDKSSITGNQKAALDACARAIRTDIEANLLPLLHEAAASAGSSLSRLDGLMRGGI